MTFVKNNIMKIDTKKLTLELIEKTKINISRIEKLKDLSKKELNYKKTNEKWSALECIEHLNLYGGFYNPEIKKSLIDNKTEPAPNFNTGLIGGYFTNSMLPKAKINKMKSPVDKNPIGSEVDKEVLVQFIKQQYEHLDLINKSGSINLTKTKIPITISKHLKLRLGDTFRFILAHNNRHITQAENTLKGAEKSM